MGWLANLFRKTTEVEYRDENGRVHKKTVYQDEMDKFVDDAVSKGATIHQACLAHVLDPMSGRRTENWIVGQDVPQDTYEKFKDGRGDLFAAISYKEGKPHLMVIQRDVWKKLAKQF